MHTSKAVIGVDIGSNSLRLVSLVGSGRPAVFSFSEVEIPQNVFSPHGIKEKKKIAISLQKALENAQPYTIQPKYACTSIPESSVFTKVITLPKLSKKELQGVINEEISQILPKALEDMEVDHQILGFEGNQADILVVAADKTLIQDLMGLFADVGLELIRLDTKPISLGRLIVSNKKDSVVLIDIGSQTSSIAIYDYGTIRVTATVPVGGESWQEILLQQDNEKKMNKNQAQDFASTLNALINEVKNAIGYYQSRSLAPKIIEKIILTGDGSQLTGMTDFFQEKLGMPATLATPDIKLMEGVNSRYFVACGAALEPPV